MLPNPYRLRDVIEAHATCPFLLNSVFNELTDNISAIPQIAPL